MKRASITKIVMRRRRVEPSPGKPGASATDREPAGPSLLMINLERLDHASRTPTARTRRLE